STATSTCSWRPAIRCLRLRWVIRSMGPTYVSAPSGPSPSFIRNARGRPERDAAALHRDVDLVRRVHTVWQRVFHQVLVLQRFRQLFEAGGNPGGRDDLVPVAARLLGTVAEHFAEVEIRVEQRGRLGRGDL